VNKKNNTALEWYIGWMFVAFTVLIYALIGVLSRTMDSNQYYVAGREVPAVYNGMATAADWMSGASFIAMAGGIYLKGYPYMAFLVGWTGGYVLVASLIAPYLRKFGVIRCLILSVHVMAAIWLVSAQLLFWWWHHLLM
jgi:Na+(H+)/acetate symporter ActP